MKPYLVQIRMTLRLMMRNRAALFFGYLLPLAFLFMFGQLMRAEQGGASQIVSMVLTIGVLGSGFFGAAMIAVMNREANILRRFKVAPISPAVILVASLVGSLANFLPMAFLMVFLAHQVYGMPYPTQPVSLFVFVSIGALAFCSIGNIIAAVVNSMQEAQIVSQIFYMPMLLLGGATIPLAIMPNWLQTVTQFLPSTHYTTGVQAILRGRETILDNLPAVGALALTVAVGTLLAVKLFRWEKEEKMRPSAKLWLVGVLAPFLVMGVWQSYAKDNVVKARVLARDLQRSRSWLIHDARLFLGDGTVIEQGSVLVKEGKIVEVYTGAAPEAKTLKAEAIEAAGKTLLPGLIDVHVHLGATGGIAASADDYSNIDKNIDRELAAYLFSGVTAVKSAGDALDTVLKHRATMASGERLGAELFAVGPLFTTAGGHGTEYANYAPESARASIEAQFVRLPKSAEEARMQVEELKARKVDGIKAVLDAGAGPARFNRMDPAILRAIADAARSANLPIVTHTGNAKDVADALDARVDGIEHGSMLDAIPTALFTRMKEMGVTYDPTLAVLEAIAAYGKGNAEPLERSMVRQVGPRVLLEKSKERLASSDPDPMRAAYGAFPFRPDLARQNLLDAYRAGVMLVAGTDSGSLLMIHGPGIHRELQLWVHSGVPEAAALQAATYNNAKLLRAANRIGLIRKGYEASLLLVDGNPMQDISATEHISLVFLKGELVARQDLFTQK